jgi:hypothetical protein
LNVCRDAAVLLAPSTPFSYTGLSVAANAGDSPPDVEAWQALDCLPRSTRLENSLEGASGWPRCSFIPYFRVFSVIRLCRLEQAHRGGCDELPSPASN